MIAGGLVADQGSFVAPIRFMRSLLPVRIVGAGGLQPERRCCIDR